MHLIKYNNTTGMKYTYHTIVCFFTSHIPNNILFANITTKCKMFLYFQ